MTDPQEDSSSAPLSEDPGATVPDTGIDTASPMETVASAAPPDHIGPFAIREKLGEGGMGAVYLGEQTEPVHRKVAIKLVHASLRGTEAMARFSAEREAMARLSHANVAHFFEAGTTDDGFPYFVMEHVEGKTLSEYCDEKRLTVEERLRLFVDICRGVEHAHRKGLLHRDLKPANVLVSEVDGRGVPKVIDFGIAKAVDAPLSDDVELTGGRLLGTPAYMSPEALRGDDDIDTRTDVYSLGVILYKLIAGVRPHEREGGLVSQFQAVVNWREPKRPSTRIDGLDQTTVLKVAGERRLLPSALSKRIKGDLDWIVMGALAEERRERYSSVGDLAADVLRHLEHKPVKARPPSTVYQMVKFVRRNRIGVAVALVLALVLALGMVGTLLAQYRAEEQAELADFRARSSRAVTSFLVDSLKVSNPGEARGGDVTAREILDKAGVRIQTELVDQPAVRVELMRTIGEVYVNLGLFDPAAILLEDALELHGQLGIERPLERAKILHALGDVYLQQGRTAEARVHLEHAVALREAESGPRHLDVAASLQLLANVFLRLTGTDEAERTLLRALEIRLEHLGRVHLDVADTYNLLGIVFADSANNESAASYFQRALEIREELLEADHPEVGKSLSNLGTIYISLGRRDEAYALLKRSLEIKKKVLGSEHPSYANGLVNLSELEPTFERREELLQEAIQILEKAAPSSAELGIAYAALARDYRAENLTVAAIESYESALAVQEVALAARHVRRENTVASLLELYDQEGRDGDAAALRQRHRTALEALGE